MPFKTTRTNENAKIFIDHEKCNACGLCVEVCRVCLAIKDGKLVEIPNPIFGCMGCGQCVAICPVGAIHIEGRTVSRTDFLKAPAKETRASYHNLYALMLGRRSIRNFQSKEIEQEKIDKIIDAASTAPMGLPPSDVGVLVLRGPAKVRAFSFDLIEYAKTLRWFFSPLTLFLMHPFLGKENYESLKSFVAPLTHFILEGKDRGEDWLLYDAPLAMYFYGSPYSSEEDASICATYAMLVAETLGLGSCMIGSIHPLLKGGKKVTKKYGIPPKTNGGLMVVFGYPKHAYTNAIKRTLGKVNYL